MVELPAALNTLPQPDARVPAVCADVAAAATAATNRRAHQHCDIFKPAADRLLDSSSDGRSCSSLSCLGRPHPFVINWRPATLRAAIEPPLAATIGLRPAA